MFFYFETCETYKTCETYGLCARCCKTHRLCAGCRKTHRLCAALRSSAQVTVKHIGSTKLCVGCRKTYKTLTTIYHCRDCTVCSKLPQFATTCLKKNFLMYSFLLIHSFLLLLATSSIVTSYLQSGLYSYIFYSIPYRE